jgi:NADH-quinone oxidoreductase subunit C
MPDRVQTLATQIQQKFGDIKCMVVLAELTIEVPRDRLHAMCAFLRDDPQFNFQILIDICGVDYLDYGQGSYTGERFAAVYHLLSVANNQRLRVRTFLDSDAPRVDSVIDIWASANWYEREAYDLFGILFVGHPDLRRLLTDYGFIGHPFRKDFPLSGNVEMRYDPERERVVYEPVSITPRVTVPRVIPHDHRYVEESGSETGNG